MGTGGELFNVPSFYLQTASMDEDPIHAAYGGNTFALVDVQSVGLRVECESLSELVPLGMRIRRFINERYAFHHPATGNPLKVQLGEPYETTSPARNVVVSTIDEWINLLVGPARRLRWPSSTPRVS